MDDSPVSLSSEPGSYYYDTHVANAWVSKNRFISMRPERTDLPVFSQAREILPDPVWTGHADVIDCYWRAWELAFGNLKMPTLQNHFAANYCDTAFNGNLFMWDSSFITCFGIYGRNAFNFQKTLDTFYRKQHPDGFICREISEADGSDTFHRFDPSSTGPNVMAWVEWNYYRQTGDRSRLELVIAPLIAYHQWLRKYHTWPDGSYWSTGWGCGMDNLPRVRGADHLNWDNSHMTWVDTTFQAILSAKILLKIADVLEMKADLTELSDELDRLCAYVNQHLWNEITYFYSDRLATGELSPVKHIGAYWALLAGCVPGDRLSLFISHLENKDEFNRTHRIPALSADDPGFRGTGDYWCGGVWAPTNYMVLKGLDATGFKDLAHQIALNHNNRVVSVYKSDETPWTGVEQFRQFFHLSDLKYDDHHTLWENYAPDAISPGSHSKPGYVGWTGIPPIALLFEDIFGLEPDAPAKRLTWQVRLLDEHGVRRYPFGRNGIVDIKCHARNSPLERPQVEIHSNTPFSLEIVWEGGKDILEVEG